MTIRMLTLLAVGTLALGTLALARQQTPEAADNAGPLKSPGSAHLRLLDDPGCDPTNNPPPGQ